MTERITDLNIAIKRYFIDTPASERKLYAIMNLLNQAGFVEAAFQDNRGKTLAVKSGDKVLGSIVAENTGLGIAKIREDGETTLRQPQSWQALTQAATWIFTEVSENQNAAPLLAFAYLDDDKK